MDENTLIEHVKGYEFLYNTNSKEYRNQSARTEAWEEIGVKLGLSGALCKEAWKKLRNAHTNAIKRRKTNDPSKIVTKWKYEDQMSFLAPHMETRQSNTADRRKHVEGCEGDSIGYPNSVWHSYVGNHDADESFCETLSKCKFEYTDSEYHMRSKSSLPETPDLLNSNSIGNEDYSRRGIKRKYSVSPLHCDASDTSQATNCANDETDLFFLSIARTAKNLSPEERTMVKLEISKIVFQAELRSIRRRNYQSEEGNNVDLEYTISNKAMC